MLFGILGKIGKSDNVVDGEFGARKATAAQLVLERMRRQAALDQKYSAQLDAEQGIQRTALATIEAPGYDEVTAERRAALLAHKQLFLNDATPVQEFADRHQRNFEGFRVTHRLLDREPCEPRSRYLHWAIIAVFVLVEAGLNSAFFAVGHPGGLLGGLQIATAAAFLNVLIAVVFGALARNVHHRFVWRRIFGWTAVAAYLAVAIVYSLAVGHYRNAVSGVIKTVAPGVIASIAPGVMTNVTPDVTRNVTLDEAGQVAMAALADPQFRFHLLAVESWALFLVGFIFGVVALYASYSSRDRYPAYSEIAALLREQVERLTQLKNWYVAGINQIFEGYVTKSAQMASPVDTIEEKRLAALAAVEVYRTSAATSRRLLLEYRAETDALTQRIAIAKSGAAQKRNGTQAHGASVPFASPAALDTARYQPADLDEKAVTARIVRDAHAAKDETRNMHTDALADVPRTYQLLRQPRHPRGSATHPPVGDDMAVNGSRAGPYRRAWMQRMRLATMRKQD